MTIRIESIKNNPANLMRGAGYAFVRRRGEEMNFVRVLSSSGYPRFHIFTKMDKSDLIINIHLDQKKNTYGKTTRHHGEYEDNELLSEEVKRIKNAIQR